MQPVYFLCARMNCIKVSGAGSLMRYLGLLLTVFTLSACAKSAVIPLSRDTIQITSSAAPACGAIGAQQVALRRAAVETIRRGYDSFVITGGGYHNNVRTYGHTPVIASTTSNAHATGYGGYAVAHGRSQTIVSGGQPIVGGTHDQGLIVKMFKEGDPLGSNAVSARATLGPKWQEAIKSNSTSCL